VRPVNARARDVALVAMAAALLGAFFLGIYPAKHYRMPVGYDTPLYLSQIRFAAERGLSGIPGHLPFPSLVRPSRPGFPIVVLTLSRLLGASTFTMAALLPVAAAIALALAAGAFVSWSLRRSAWEAAVVAVIVGTSLVVIRMFAPETYTDNLIAAGLFLAALVPLMSFVLGGRGWVASSLLLAVAGLVHDTSFLEMVAVLVVLALLYAPSSVRAWRAGRRPFTATPCGRVAIATAGGTAGAAALAFGLLRAAPNTPQLTRRELTKKLREDLPLYRFPLTIPLAAWGAAALAVGGRGKPERERLAAGFLLRVAGSWTAVTAGGILLFVVGRNSPAHRFLSFFLPLPILIAIGLLAAGARVARPAGVAVVLVGLIGLGFLGYHTLYVELPADRGIEWTDPAKIADAQAAAAYLDAAGIPRTSPVVFVVDDLGPNPLSYVPEMAYLIRSVLPADRIVNTHLYVGDPVRYLEGRPTFRPSPPTYDQNAARFWPAVRALLPRRPVAMVLASFNPAFGALAAAHPDWVVGRGLIVLQGPRLAGHSAPPALPSFPGPAGLALLGAATVAALGLIGIGWAWALLPPTRLFEVVSLAPAFGTAMLVVTGLVIDQAGLRLDSWDAAAAGPVAAAAGAALAYFEIIRRRRSAAAGR